MQSTATVSKLTLEITPDQAAQQWVDAKEKIAGLEERLEVLKPYLVNYLKAAPKKTATLAGRVFKLSRQARENFSLKDALAKLGRPKLEPFIKISRYWQIDPCWKKRAA